MTLCRCELGGCTAPLCEYPVSARGGGNPHCQKAWAPTSPALGSSSGSGHHPSARTAGHTP